MQKKRKQTSTQFLTSLTYLLNQTNLGFYLHSKKNERVGLSFWHMGLGFETIQKKCLNLDKKKRTIVLIFPVYYCLKKYSLISFVLHIVSIIFCLFVRKIKRPYLIDNNALNFLSLNVSKSTVCCRFYRILSQLFSVSLKVYIRKKRDLISLTIMLCYA